MQVISEPRHRMNNWRSVCSGNKAPPGTLTMLRRSERRRQIIRRAILSLRRGRDYSEAHGTGCELTRSLHVARRCQPSFSGDVTRFAPSLVVGTHRIGDRRKDLRRFRRWSPAFRLRHSVSSQAKACTPTDSPAAEPPTIRGIDGEIFHASDALSGPCISAMPSAV